MTVWSKRITLVVVSVVAGLSLFMSGPQAVAETTSGMTAEQVRQQLQDLEAQQQDLAAKRVAAQEKLTAAQNQLATTQEQIVSEKNRISQLSSQVAQIALQQYQDRGMNTTTMLISSSSSSDLLGYITVMQQVTSTANTLLTDLQFDQATLADLERSEQAAVESIAAEQTTLAGLEADNQVKVNEAAALLQRMTALASAQKTGSSGINAVGSGVSDPTAVVPAPSGSMISPLSSYTVTSPFSMRVHPIWGTYSFHDGLDMGAGCGTPVLAPANGFVIDYYWAGGYGNRLVIDNGIVDGHHIVTSYNHLSAGVAQSGEAVTQGQTVAKVGSTGDSTGCHLHYMVWSDGQLMDPAGYVG
ncbi:MAG: peptidoglycan DD-metalloendopeptidase family protein [Propionibacteriaceae bacterium]|jgi:murein DD-endopeptidase MepM/ murein hydrolase activator NlpD|nr:peptidoglycan DD-metalloendopeptidase family protein [Propionibacteriaceae bacterium]